MGRALGLYLRLIGAQVRSEMQYRASFLAELIGNFAVTALDFAAMLILLNRFHSVGSWSLAEVAFLYGTSTVSFSLAELFAGAFDGFDRWVVRGEFDRLLIRPLSIPFQMMTSAFPLRRLGRLAQGLLALGFAFYLLHPVWPLGHWLFLGVMLAGGLLVFLAVFIAGASAAFWTPQTSELTNVFTYGGQFMTSYPMHIYQAWLRSIFTFIVPLAFINYYPSLYLLGKADPLGLPEWVPFLAPLLAGAAIAAALALWRLGVRRYQGTGS
jgi:ABC-2 type transport system permease protein